MNLGKFEVSFDAVEESVIANILAEMKFIPTRVEAMWHKKSFEYIGLSPLFRDIKTGEIAPEYEVIITYDGPVKVKERA